MGKKREGMQRMLVIINKLKGPQQYVPRKELENYVTHRMEERDGTPVDIRTLQRDFKDIECFGQNFQPTHLCSCRTSSTKRQ